MNDVLVARIRHAAAEVFSASPVFLAYAHGSRVSGTARATSDLDVGYYLMPGYPERQLPFSEEMRLVDQLSAALDIEVDLRALALAPIQLRGRVLEEGVRVYCDDEEARVELETYLLGHYLDYKREFEALRHLRFAAAATRLE